MDKDDSAARKPGPNDATDDVGNVVGNNKKGAASDSRGSADSGDTAPKGRTPSEFKMYPRPDRSKNS